MNIYGIADLHLSGIPPFKPMERFGPEYDNYMERIEAGFKSLPPDSIVINAGDISWSIDREEALTDLRWLNSFGVKIINTLGNHDYWWGKKGAAFMSNWALDNKLDNMYFVDHQQLFTLGNSPVTIAAVKGSERFEQFVLEFNADELPPGHRPKGDIITPKYWDKHKRKLEAALALNPVILVSHIPPFDYMGEANELTHMINATKSVQMILFGHRHKAALNRYDCPQNPIVDGKVWFNLLAERLNFKPVLIGDIKDDKFVFFSRRVTG